MTKSIWMSMALVVFSVSLGYGATGSAISGTVKGPDGAPYMGSFVRARNQKTKMTVSVLSDRQGRYRMENLPSGDYEIQVKAIGYKADPRFGIKLAEGQTTTFDFALQKTMVRWSDISNYEGTQLLPEGEGREEYIGTCFACHAFQTRLAGTRRDEQGIVRSVEYMAEEFKHFFGNRLTPERKAKITNYMIKTFALDSDLPRSPTDLPKYKELKRPQFTDESMKLVVVDYETAGPSRFPGTGRPDKNGNIWMWNYHSNNLSMLNKETGMVREWKVPNQGPANIHAVVPAADGSVWLTESSQANKLARFDPRTETFEEYQDSLDGDPAKGRKHTAEIDLQGNVWSTGRPLTKFDPRTKKFTHFDEVPQVYGVGVDKEGTVWFAEFTENGKIGKVDVKTNKVTKYTPPSPDPRPRRLKIDSKGMIWFGEYRAGKIGRFDPKTETFKEFQLPGPSPTPYGLGIDKNDHIWYTSMEMDVVGRLDPATGEVTQYPMPYSEVGTRDLFPDATGEKMWYGTQPNDRVGYFMIATDK